MRRIGILLTLLITIPFATSMAQERNSNRLFEWGVRAGVNAVSLNIPSASINGEAITPPSTSSHLGLLTSLFTRCNLLRSYLQLEVEANYTRTDIQLSTQDFFPQVPTQHVTTLKNSMQSIDIPLLYGFNVVRSTHNELSIFTGAKFKFVVEESSHVGGDSQRDFTLVNETIPPHINWVVGLGTTVSSLFLDFRYEIGLKLFANNIEYLYQGINMLPIQGSAQLNRRIHMLSFSIGYLF